MYKFLNNEKPGLIVFPNGMIFAKNNMFDVKFKGHDIVGYKFFKFFQTKVGNQVTNLKFNNEEMS